MRRSRFVALPLAWLVLSGGVAFADDVTDLPVAVSVAFPENALDLRPNPTDAGGARCTTTAVSPVDDGSWIRGEGALECGASGLTAVLKGELHRYESATGPAIGAGGHKEEGQLSPPLVVRPTIGHYELGPGFYRTIIQSRVTYPYRLNRSASPGTGCYYFDGFTIVCNTASQPVALGIPV